MTLQGRGEPAGRRAADRGRRANVALFVPHAGCPHQCSFCNQRAITGRAGLPSDADIQAAAETALRTLGEDARRAEIAFFGGSFTAIDRREMIRMLDAAYPYVADGRFRGVRLSTRPDAVDQKVLAQLGERGVTAVELGAQSMDDRVLRMNGRGHTATQVEQASRLIREAGMELGLQMMTGLYGDTDAGARETARRLLALRPDTMRIYPTVVLEGTRLADLCRRGLYAPQTLEEAADLCADLLGLFQAAGVPVIRLGLHAIEQARYVAGPWHPAFREICEGKIYLRAALDALAGQPPGRYSLFVQRGAVSRMAGQNRRNLEALSKRGYACKVREGEEATYRVRAVREEDEGAGRRPFG